MDKLNRKLTHIEKTLNKMTKEITKIRNGNDAKSKNASRNNGYYNKNSMALTNQQNYNSKKYPPKKNYFQLTDKEKNFKENKKKTFKDTIPIDKKPQKDNFYIYKDTNNFIDNNFLLMENNFGYKSNNVFFDYKAKTKQNIKQNNYNNSCYRNNNSKVANNTSYYKNKNHFKNLSVDEKEIIKEGINSKHNVNYPYSFSHNYNSCVNINEYSNYPQLRKNPQHKNNKYNSTINLKSNIYKLKNNPNSKFNEFENLNRNFINSNKNDNVENTYYKEKYKYLRNILKNRSIEEINSKANFFDKFGINGFKEFFNKKKFSNNDKNNQLNCLLEYKNFIECLNTKNEYYYKKQIENYECLCGKLIHLTKKEDLEKIKEKINLKLQKNHYNNNLLINIQNILNYLDSENN